jgi:hypothetical protein
LKSGTLRPMSRLQNVSVMLLSSLSLYLAEMEKDA